MCNLRVRKKRCFLPLVQVPEENIIVIEELRVSKFKSLIKRWKSLPPKSTKLNLTHLEFSMGGFDTAGAAAKGGCLVLRPCFLGGASSSLSSDSVMKRLVAALGAGLVPGSALLGQGLSLS
jgi:hypothetical protein